MATWKKVVTESSSGVISQKAANVSDSDFGDITVSSGSWTIDNNVVDASALNVSGNGTSGYSLTSNGSGGFNWTNIDTATNLDISNFAGTAITTSGESFADNDTSLMTSAAIEDKIESYGYGAGDITGVTIACDTNSVADGSSNVNFTLTGGTGVSTVANAANGTMTITLNAQLQDIAGMTAAETTALATISETTFGFLHGRGSDELQSIGDLNDSDDGIMVNHSSSTTAGDIKVTTFSSVKNAMDDLYWNFAHTSGIRVSGGDCAFDNDVVITGNLTVNGTQTVLNTTTLAVEDKLIKIADTGTPTTTTGSHSGIQVETSATEANWPDLKWTKDQGAHTATTGTATGLTGWIVSNHRTSGYTDHPIAIMDFDSAAPTGSDNSAGVGSFWFDDGELYLRTA